jgi:glutamate-1-semialdehyde 2,1-aminomutase
MAAGVATLTALAEPGVYERLEARAAQVEDSLLGAAAKAAVPVTINRVGAMLTMFFSAGPVDSFAAAMRADTDRYARYFRHMLERGVYLAPSQFESVMISLALTDTDFERASAAATEFFTAV